MSHVIAHCGLAATLDNRSAAATGALGVFLTAALGLLMVHVVDQVADDKLDELDFTPGMIMALGSPDASPSENPGTMSPADPPPDDPLPDDPLPDDPLPDDPLPDDSPPDDAVTDEPTAPRPRPVRPRPPARPRPGSQSPGSKLPTPAQPGPPGTPSRGNPFGDPGGFDDLNRDGDPWAGRVIAALDAMDVGTVYAEPIGGSITFELTLCRSGTVKHVGVKGSTMSKDHRDLVLLELRRLKLPPLPARLAAQMKGQCAKLRHRFTWSVKGVR